MNPRSAHVLLGALLLLLTGGCAVLKALFPPPLPPGAPEDALRIQGGEARAAGLAMADLVEHRQASIARLEELRDGGMEGLPEVGSLLKCLAQADSYDVFVGRLPGRYRVKVLPVAERCVAGAGEIRGGGATYEFDAESYAVLHRSYDQ